MTLRKAPASLVCAAAALLAQSCVQYTPAAGYPPPPQPPSDSPQYAGPPAPQAPPRGAAPTGADSTDDALVAPIALYPDPLIALILPASTAPGDISAAAAYLVQYGDMSRIDSQPWDPSVRGLAHYPTVVEWMAQNMPWTQALGSAFLSSPSDVMDAIQWMRSRALAAGTLTSTPQEQVYSDGGLVYIYPAQPDYVYVPAYDDTLVYSDGPYNGYGGPFISFGDPYPAGEWLSFYFDWGRHRVWSGDRSVWNKHDGWQPPRNGGDRSPPGARPWHPSTAAPRVSPPTASRGGNSTPHPRPMPGAPAGPSVRNGGPAGQPAGAPASRGQAPLPRSAAPAPGNPSRPAASSPHQELPRTVPGAPGRTPGAYPPPPAPSRQYAPAPARGGSTAPHESAPAPHESAPAPAPAQNNGSNTPQK